MWIIFLKSCFCKRELIGLEVFVQSHESAEGYMEQKSAPHHAIQFCQIESPDSDGFIIRTKDELFIFFKAHLPNAF